MALPLHGRCPHLERGPHTPTHPPYPYPLGGEHLPTPPPPHHPLGLSRGLPPSSPTPSFPIPDCRRRIVFPSDVSPGGRDPRDGGGEMRAREGGGGRKEKPKEGRVVLTLPMLGLRMGIASMEHPGGVLPE